MNLLHLEIHPQTPQARHIKTIADMLRRDALLLYPTDSGYAVGCSAANPKAINKLYALKKPLKKFYMALLLPEISKATDYARINNFAFQILRSHTPGPYTFILPADPQIARKLDVNRSEIGVRISPHIFMKSLFENFEHPILSTAAKIEEGQEFTKPEELMQIFKSRVDVFADMGEILLSPTNVVNLCDNEVSVIRGSFPV
ncbi:MAG: threonylcarbamoyl-AMP synthase [Fibromonadaceae bacterium]|jgi:tRNA threonylcarbamoyl adenosine modification protein (Sua5/YciO/YrdC/YwlC family)|nr:threonylcarbamoyl-AMP synthase [Fibromonadaceae bacterium]